MDLFSGGAKAGLLAAGELRKLRKRDEVRSLINRTVQRLQSDHRVRPSAKRAVREKVKGLPIDPHVGWWLKQLLDGDRTVLPQLERRVSQLLTFAEEVDDRLVVVAFMEIAQEELLGAKADDRKALGAIYREQTSAHDHLAGQLDEVLAQGQANAEALAQLQGNSGEQPGSPTRVSALALLTQGPVLGQHTPDLLKELALVDAALAEEASARLAEGGGLALAAWSQLHKERMAAKPAELVGRLLMSEAQYDDAEHCFLRAAELDPADRVRQLVRASNAAFTADRAERASHLLAEARGIDSTHPGVVIAEVRQGDLANDEVIKRLESVKPASDADRINRGITLGQAYLVERRFEEADEALNDAEGAAATEFAVREMRALWRLLRVERTLQAESEPDLDELAEARESFLGIREELHRVGRFNEAGHMLARATQTHISARETDAAAELLDSSTEEERRGDGALAMARLGVMCDRTELALEIVAVAPESEQRQLIAAEIGTSASDAATREASLASLDQLLYSESAQVRLEAALARGLACLGIQHPAAWSPRAEEILAEQNEPMATVMRARAHLAHGEFVEAEDLLRPRAEDPKALDALVDSAAMQRDFAHALERSQSLLRLRDTASNRLQHGKLLRVNNDLSAALAVLTDVARGAEPLLPGQRVEAFREALMCAQDLDRFKDMVELADDAIGLAAEDANLRWARAYARFRLGRHDEALADLDDQDIEPRSLGEAELLSRILYRAGDRATVIERLLDLSERFERPETLEFMVIVASRHAGVLEDNAERVRKTFQGFSDRFPDSTYLVQIEVPQTEEGVRAWLEEMAPDPDRGLDIAQAVRRGEMPTAVLAATHSKSVAQLWPALTLLPVSYGDPSLADLELQDARAAITAAAVLDPSSLAVLAMVGPEIEAAVRNALPGSLIAQSTLEDADRAVDPGSDPRESSGLLTRDSAGQPRLVPTEEGDAARRASLHETQIRLAKELSVEPDAVPGSDDNMERALLGKGEAEVDPALKTWAATMTVARRLGIPALSDDRRVRVYLRADGGRCFGTLSLLRALIERGDITEQAYEDARLRLLDAGGVGLKPTAEELSEIARRNGWRPTGGLYSLLSDPAWWSSGPLTANAACAGLLAACAAEAPAELAAWTARVLDGAHEASPGVPTEHLVMVLLATAWGWTSEMEFDRTFLHQLIDALKAPAARPFCGDLNAPELAALERFVVMLQDRPPQLRAALVLKAVSRLRLREQMRALVFLGIDIDLRGTGW